jgi:hypothetical protein
LKSFQDGEFVPELKDAAKDLQEVRRVRGR